MSKSDNQELRCSVAMTMRILGDGWTLIILRDFMIFGGTRRFEQLREGLNISRNVLTERLNTLLDEEIIRKKPIAEGARRMEYKLSRKGWELMPILGGVYQWCERWGMAPGQGQIEFVDTLKGEPLQPLTLIAADDRKLGPPDVKVRSRTEEAAEYLRKYQTPPKK